MRFRRQLYPHAIQYPALFRELTGVTVEQFNTLIVQTSQDVIRQDALNNHHYVYFTQEMLMYYLMILKHSISSSCISELSLMTDSDCKRMLIRFSKYCNEEEQLQAVSEQLYLRSRFIAIHKNDEGRLPKFDVVSLKYLELLLPDRFHKQFQCILNPELRIESVQRLQTFFRRHGRAEPASNHDEELDSVANDGTDDKMVTSP